jgi:DNA-binding LytR/AlgR family response regulator
MKLALAVVEDDDAEFDAIKASIEKFGTESEINFTVERFVSADLLLAVYKPTYDIIFMDIGLPGIDGFEASKKLRQIDENVLLIFVTSMSKFAVSGYEVGAFDFIVKPVKYGNLKLKLLRVIDRLKASADQKIKVQTGDGLRIVPISSIKYVEVMNRSIIYHTEDGDVSVYGSLKNVESTLPEKQFVKCNNCYLVNLSHVSSVKGFTAIVGGEELTLSRSRKKEFLQALGAYMEGI